MTKQVTAAEACRRHGITETTLVPWREQALEGIVNGLERRDVGTRREAELEREIAALERKRGQVTMIADLRSKALQRWREAATEVGKKWLAGEVAPACRIARALPVSHQRRPTRNT